MMASKKVQEMTEQNPGLVDMEVTPENPIVITREDDVSNRQIGGAVSIPQHLDGDGQRMFQQSQSTVSNELVERSTGEILATVGTNETQVAEQAKQTQILLADGNYSQPHFGSKDMHLTRQEGIVGSDFTNANLGTQHIHQDITNIYVTNRDTDQPDTSSETKKRGRKKKKKPKKVDSDEDDESENEDHIKLSDSIWIFREEKLSEKGNVFKGEMTSPIYGIRIIAIKFIPHSDKNVKEAKVLLKLTPHKNVVSIIHADEYLKGPMKYMYIAMDMCNTQNLKEYIVDRKDKGIPFNLKLSLKHTQQLLEAIEHIHGKNIIHRDLKPGNILFSLCGAYLKIVDFGLSKELENGHTVTGVSTLEVDTDGYRAPETYNRNVISLQADIFSLGLVVYHLWSYGHHPFGDDLLIWNYNIKKNLGLDLSNLLVPNVPSAKELLESMLQFEPDQRPKIRKILNDQYFKQDMSQQLVASLSLIWSGTVECSQIQDASMNLSCEIYQTPNIDGPEQTITENINGQDWANILPMKLIPNVEIGDLKDCTDSTPSGYLVSSSNEEIQELTKKMSKTKQMGWIEIVTTEEGGKNKILLLVCSQEYPELYGFLLPDQSAFLSHIQGIISNQESRTGEPQGDNAEVSAAKSVFEALTSGTQSRGSDKTSSAMDSGSQESKLESIEDEVTGQTSSNMSEQCQQQQGQSSKSNKNPTSRDMIPWWVFPEVERME